MSASPPPVAHPAATVVLLRDGRQPCEVLLVQRSARLKFHGGAWVFPGGRLDAEDYVGAPDLVAAARRAAVREAREEVGLTIRSEPLVLMSRWVTPVQLPKRFDTWFFAAPGDDASVAIDGGEIHDHRWMSPSEALAAHCSGALALPPPTFVTLSRLAPYADAGAALAGLQAAEVGLFEPRLFPVEGGAVSLYGGDAGYDSGELERPGPRHRLWILESGWRYDRG